jgi:ubiquinone biosynthesis protein COQ4
MPKSTRAQPLIAIRALRQLIADPEDTSRVFEIIRALGGPSLRQGLKRFRATAVGARVLRENINLLDVLKDRDWLQSLPVGTLGRTYYEFIYGEALSADGLVEASVAKGDTYDFDDPDLRRFGERMRDQHDVWHTLTQYGRDELGEACLLGFTYAQTGNRGVGLIALVGGLKIRQALGRGVLQAIWRGYQAGNRAQWLPAQPWEELLERPIQDVRRELHLTEPREYQVLRDNFAGAAPA